MSHVSGLAYLELLDGGSYYLPCDIEWSTEGKYLLFQRKHKSLVSDDIFVIQTIHILGDNKVMCKLYNSIEMSTGEKFNEVVIELYFDQYDKIIGAEVAENVIDMNESEDMSVLPEIIPEPLPETLPKVVSEINDHDHEAEKETETDHETENKPEIVVKKPRWYKPWRYFW